MSLSAIAVVAAIAVGATTAFFSDTETSTGNTFTAGAIDLRIDNECNYGWNNQLMPCPNNPNGPNDGGYWTSSWSETDLGRIHKFFYFDDIKPGDWGEDTISIHVYDNDAWGKMAVRWYANQDKDNTCTEPETESALEPGCDDDADGELDNHMTFTTWLDQGRIPGFQCGGSGLDQGRIPRCPHDPWEGDNIWQDGDWVDNDDGENDWDQPEPMIETHSVDEPKPVNAGADWIPSFFDVFFDIDTAMMDAARANECREDGHNEYGRCHGLAWDGRLVGSVTYYIGWMWRFDVDAGNEAQTDMLGGDMWFKAVQHRNNPDKGGL